MLEHTAAAQCRPNLDEIPVEPLRVVEQQTILRAMKETAGNKLAAAKLLGIGRTTLYRKLKEYGESGPLH